MSVSITSPARGATNYPVVDEKINVVGSAPSSSTIEWVKAYVYEKNSVIHADPPATAVEGFFRQGTDVFFCHKVPLARFPTGHTTHDFQVVVWRKEQGADVIIVINQFEGKISTRPTVTLSASTPNNGKYTITAEFSEAVTNMAADDFQQVNATLDSNSFTGSSGDTIYTIIAEHSGTDPMSVWINDNAAIASVGSEQSLASNILNIDYVSPLLVEDQFTEPSNGTLLSNHTPNTDVQGLGWQTSANGDSEWTIQNSKARYNSIQNEVLDDIIAYIDAGDANVDISVELEIDPSNQVDGGWAGIVLRYADDDNFLLVQINQSGNIELWKRASGTWAPKLSSDTVTASNTYTLRVTVDSSDDIKVYCDGVLKAGLSVTETAGSSNENHGLYAAVSDPGNQQYGDCEFDSFQIDSF